MIDLRFETLQKRVERLEVLLSGSHDIDVDARQFDPINRINFIEENLSEQTEKVNSLTEENDTLKSTVSNLETTCDYLRGEVDTLKNNVAFADGEISHLKDAVSNLNRGY